MADCFVRLLSHILPVWATIGELRLWKVNCPSPMLEAGYHLVKTKVHGPLGDSSDEERAPILADFYLCVPSQGLCHLKLSFSRT